jgi:hypothetical protein
MSPSYYGIPLARRPTATIMIGAFENGAGWFMQGDRAGGKADLASSRLRAGSYIENRQAWHYSKRKIY